MTKEVENITKILEKLDDTLKIAVCEHLEADQDVGVLLSGGIDSSLVASYASQLSLKNIKLKQLLYIIMLEVDQMEEKYQEMLLLSMQKN